MREPTAPDLTDPASFTYFHRENTRFSDTDMVGHVNNVAHVALVECARIAFAFQLAAQTGLEAGQISFVRLEIDFRDDLWYPTTVRIGVRVLAVGNSSFTLGIGVFDGDRCVTTSRNVLVHLGQDRRPAPLPQPFRSSLQEQLSAQDPLDPPGEGRGLPDGG